MLTEAIIDCLEFFITILKNENPDDNKKIIDITREFINAKTATHLDAAVLNLKQLLSSTINHEVIRARHLLGFCYEYGIGVENDINRSLEYYKESAKEGYSLSLINLGNYAWTEKDDVITAYDYYLQAAKQGCTLAKASLRSKFIHPNLYDETALNTRDLLISDEQAKIIDNIDQKELSEKQKIKKGSQIAEGQTLDYSLIQDSTGTRYLLYKGNKGEEKFLLGQGAFGRVKIAQNLSSKFNEFLAAKIITYRYKNSGNVERWQKEKDDIMREKDILASLGELKGFLFRDNKCYFFQRLIRGRRAFEDSVIENPTALFNTIHELNGWMKTAISVLRALNKIHSRDIVHRDLHESNVLYNKIEGASIIDFGRAQFLSGKPYFIQPEPFGILPNFAPELRDYKFDRYNCNGYGYAHFGKEHAPFSKASDLYSIGFLFTRSLMRILKYCTKDFSPLEPLSKVMLCYRKIDELVLPMLNEDPNKRPNALECIQAFSNLQKQFEKDLKDETDFKAQPDSNPALTSFFKDIQQGDLEKVKKGLAENATFLNARNDHNVNAIWCAFFYGRKEIAEFLYAKKADVYVFNNLHSLGLIHLAAKNGWSDFIQKLVKEKGLDINARNYLGNNVLAFSSQCKESCIAKALELGANVNNINRLQKTPIWEATRRGNLGVVELLEQNKADFRIVPGHPFSLLLLAYLGNQNLELASFLYRLYLVTGNQAIISPYHEENDEAFKILKEELKNLINKPQSVVSLDRNENKEQNNVEPNSNKINSETNQKKPDEDKKKNKIVLARSASLPADLKYRARFFTFNNPNKRKEKEMVSDYLLTLS